MEDPAHVKLIHIFDANPDMFARDESGRFSVSLEDIFEHPAVRVPRLYVRLASVKQSLTASQKGKNFNHPPNNGRSLEPSLADDTTIYTPQCVCFASASGASARIIHKS
jgi:hypothetical protein